MGMPREDRWMRLTLELHLGEGREKLLSSRIPIDGSFGDVAGGQPVGHLIADVLKFSDAQVLGDEYRFLVLARAILLVRMSVPSKAPRSVELRELIRAAAEFCAVEDAPPERGPEEEDDDE